MKNLTLTLLFFFPCIACQEASTASAGFEEAMFDKVTIENLLKDERCTDVRFYNVLPNNSSAKGTVLCIGVDSEDNELPNSQLSYKQYVGLSGKIVEIQGLIKGKAKQACIRMRDEGFFSYCVEFSRKDLKDMLQVENADAIRLTPAVLNNQGLTMKAEAISLASEQPVPLGIQFTCPDPCPILCGAKYKYLHLE